MKQMSTSHLSSSWKNWENKNRQKPLRCWTGSFLRYNSKATNQKILVSRAIFQGRDETVSCFASLGRVSFKYREQYETTAIHHGKQTGTSKNHKDFLVHGNFHWLSFKWLWCFHWGETNSPTKHDPQMMIWKLILLFKVVICMFHISFRVVSCSFGGKATNSPWFHSFGFRPVAELLTDVCQSRLCALGLSALKKACNNCSTGLAHAFTVRGKGPGFGLGGERHPKHFPIWRG